MMWSPELIRQVVKAYGKSDPVQKVSLAGKPIITPHRAQRWVIASMALAHPSPPMGPAAARTLLSLLRPSWRQVYASRVRGSAIGPWRIHEPGTLRLEQALRCNNHIALARPPCGWRETRDPDVLSPPSGLRRGRGYRSAEDFPGSVTRRSVLRGRHRAAGSPVLPGVSPG